MRGTPIARLLLAVILLALLAAPSASRGGQVPAAASAAALRTVLSTQMAHAGPRSGAYVLDQRTGQVLFDERGNVERAPASVEKLYTMTTAVAQFGPLGTLDTDVYGVGALDARRVWHGDLFLHGGGDPTFGDAAFDASVYGAGTTVQTLAATLIARTGIVRVDGSIVGDASFFDALRGPPATDGRLDLPDLGGSLSALAFDRGESTATRPPAALAAYRLAGALRARGVTVTGPSRMGITPSLRAQLLASAPSPTLTTLAALTLRPSDNFFAETILKTLGATFGGGGTSSAGAADVRAFIGSFGIRPKIVDGSGLSRSDHTSPAQVVTLLRDLSPGGVPALQATGVVVRAALPVVAVSGTLSERMSDTVAAGNCIAKTGTLDDASSLAGICDGRYAFAFLENGVNVNAAHRREDAMTIAVARLGYSSASSAASSITGTPRRSAFANLEPGASPVTR